MANLVATNEKFRLIVGSFTGISNGAWISAWVIFATTYLGFELGQIATLALVGGILGISASYPIGWLADKYSVGKVWSLLLGIRFLLLVGLIFLSPSNVIASAFVVGNLAIQSPSAGLAASYVSKRSIASRRVGNLARVRVIQHVGYAVAAALVSLAVYIDSSLQSASALRYIFGLSALSTLFGAIYIRNSGGRGGYLNPDYSRRASQVVYNVDNKTNMRSRFVAFAALSSIGLFCWPFITVGIPIIFMDSDFVYLAPLLVGANFVAVPIIQELLGRSAMSWDMARKMLVLASVLLSVGMLMVFGVLLFWDTIWLVVMSAAVGIVIISFAECLLMQSRWFVAVESGADESLSRRQSLMGMTDNAVVLGGPAVIVFAVSGSFVMFLGFVVMCVGSVWLATSISKRLPVDAVV